MTWDAYHRRDAVLREVMTVAETRRDGRLPWSEVAGAEQAFGTAENLLGALQMRWYTRLSGAIERELTEQPWDLEQAVVHARRALSGDMPGVRAILDAHADEPAMRAARRKEWSMLATASGLAAMDDPGSVRLGREVEERARAVTVDRSAPVPEPTPEPTRERAPEPAHRADHRADHRVQHGWLTRLKHALAA